MNTRALKYTSPFIIYAGAWLSFTVTGWVVWLPLVWAWVIIPFAELFIKPNPANMNAAEEELAKKDRTYDFLIYFIVILQYAILVKFLFAMSLDDMKWYDIAGRVGVMGLLCGTFGINVGHELGHRVNKFEQILAKALLLTSLYMHFFTEHNKGHHKRVATPEDPSSARYGEAVYTFYFRTIIFSWLSAWHIANTEMKKKARLNPARPPVPVRTGMTRSDGDAVGQGGRVFSLTNEMIQFSLIQITFVTLIFFVFGWFVGLYFLAAALIGILLLETVNYIEHYGLQRKSTGNGNYERAMPVHSWNSDHVIGRIMLFELSRHSDHHYLASRKYQVLRHHDNSPQMPTGYPGMMILSLFPPAWFYVMNRRIMSLQKT